MADVAKGAMKAILRDEVDVAQDAATLAVEESKKLAKRRAPKRFLILVLYSYRNSY